MRFMNFSKLMFLFSSDIYIEMCIYAGLYSNIPNNIEIWNMLGYIVVLILIFRRKLHTVFYRGYTNLHSQQCTEILFSPHPHKYLWLLSILIKIFLTDVKWCGFDLQSPDD